MKKEYILRGAFILISLFVLLGIILAFSPRVSSKATDYTYVQQNIQVMEDFEYTNSTTSEECLTKIKDCNSYIFDLKEQVVDANTEQQAYTEIARVLEIKSQYIVDYNNLLEYEAEEAKWQEKAAEYPEATYIWRYMKEEFGWSDEVCAGIMGNMMSECGGQTLKGLSNWAVDGSSGYGLIQWIGGRRRAIEKKYGSHPTIEEQLLFMRDEMYGTNGVTNQLYKEGWLEAIMNSDTPEKAAANFARYFERPASSNYTVRQNNARKAYNFFVD